MKIIKKGLNCILFCFVVLLFINFSFAQNPSISYIIPDIGTPGFSVYVEIVSSHNAFGNFGNDTIYFNNWGNVRIVFDRPGDTDKVIVGPIAVSWQGRLISTYFFVKPNIETPNTSDWRNLDSKFRIPFRVQNGGSFSNVDTFYIVKPFSFGSALQSNRIFGASPLGVRSPSGAMIVDSLPLANVEYKAFLDNTISFPFPNRTYLPFIILCINNVVGSGSSTNINVNAGEGLIQNAGPGGGGGGGRFCDYLSGNPGEEGGRGFVSGGRGGTNNLFGGGTYKSLSSGTGDSGKSLNGVPPPDIPFGYEASGGGTGHPFGKSGIGSGDQSNWNHPGGYGGGTGSINNTMGGGGGFATSGESQPSNYLNGGKVHGNRMVVPIAGGSGGASGNPSGLNVCAGSGGGGGGAIRIFAKKVENFSITADGHNGGSSGNGAGGGGSGGSIGVFAKLNASNLNLSVRGGNGGGSGYVRIDAPNISNVTVSPSSPQPYRGITTDTSSYVAKKFTLTGSKSSQTDSILLFIKPESSDWYLYRVLSGLKGTTSWQYEIFLKERDTIFFLCAIEDVGTSLVDTFSYVPRFVYSQSSTNILRISKYPTIAGKRYVELNAKECPGVEIVDSVPIINVGNAPLFLDFVNSQFKNNIGFEIVEPKNSRNLLPDDTLWVKFKLTIRAGLQNPIIDTLLVPHNDQYSDYKPWEIAIRINIEKYLFDLISTTDFVAVDTINLGVYCLNLVTDTSIRILNRSNFGIEFGYLYPSSKFDLFNSLSFLTKDQLDTLRIYLKNLGTKGGENIDSIIVFPKECPILAKTVYIKYFNVIVGVNFEEGPVTIDTLFIGEVCIGKKAGKYFVLHNLSNYPINIENINIVDTNSFDFLLSNRMILEINDTTLNYVEFAPIQEGDYTSKVYYSFDLCGYNDSLVVVGKGVSTDLVVLGGTNFGFVPVGESDTSVVIVVNRGEGIAYIDQPPQSSPEFTFIKSEPDLPVYLQKGDTLKLYYAFKPQKDSVYKFDTNISGDNSLPSVCDNDLWFQLYGIGTYARILANVDSVFMGIFPYCKSKDTIIYIRNGGTTDLLINRVYVLDVNVPQHFSLSNSLSSRIPANGIDSCVVKFEGRRGATPGLKTAKLVIESNDINTPVMEIELSAIQENLQVYTTPDTLDFGVVQIGDKLQKDLKLMNRGTIEQRTSDIWGTTGDFIPNPKVLVLVPSIEDNIVVTFSPSKEGLIYDTLRIIYYIPCPDTQFVIVRGIGVGGSFYYPDSLDFGVSSICENDTLEFEIKNLGTIPFRIDSAKIGGNDGVFFRFLSILPVQVDSTVKLRIAFIGNNGVRQYNATLQLFAFINKTTKSVEIPIIAYRQRFIEFETSNVYVGAAGIGMLRDTLTSLINRGKKTGRIFNILPWRNPPNFSLDSLKIGDVTLPDFSLNALIIFTPQRTGWIYDTLGVVIQYEDCFDTVYLYVSGVGIVPYDFTLRLPEVTMNPKESRTFYPVYIKLKSPVHDSLVLPVEVGPLVATFTYNWHLFHITGITDGEIIADVINNEFRTITFQMDSSYINSEGEEILTQFVGIPLLGDVEETPVFWNDVQWYWCCSNGWVTKTQDAFSGKIRTTVCTEGGSRLIKPGVPSKLIINNIGSEQVILKLVMGGKGTYRIDIFNVLGQMVFSDLFENIENASNEYEIELPETLPSSVYFVRLNYNGEIQIYQLIK